jgi:hypothetical protein
MGFPYVIQILAHRAQQIAQIRLVDFVPFC